MNNYKSRHFKITDLVPYEVYTDLGPKAWQLVDTRLVESMDLIADRVGELQVNNWKSSLEREIGSKRYDSKVEYSENVMMILEDTTILQYEGFRPFWCRGPRYSPHRNGRAVNLRSKLVSPQELSEVILDMSRSGELPYVTFIEVSQNHCHIDVRQTGSESVLYVNKCK